MTTMKDCHHGPPQKTLSEADPEMARLLSLERQRQTENLELIASENFTSLPVMELLGSCLTNKYSEGQPGARYYGGNEVIDQIENLCKTRSLKAFGLDPSEWDVNVQPYSGSPANLAVYMGLLKPHDRLMGLDLPSGGHLTHGFYTPKKKITASALFFESLPYEVNPATGLIDFEKLREQAKLFRPKLIICGTSAYPRHLDFAQFREIADSVGAYLMADIAHISGLVATGLHPSPFPHCDVVTSTTHKTLRGPRSGVIFICKGRLGKEGKDAIDSAVFPGLQGGPHNNNIAAVATQMLEVSTPQFKVYCQSVIDGAKAIASTLLAAGCTLVTGGTDNHLVLWDLRPKGLAGSKFEKVAEAAAITLNKNCVPGDSSALSPGGVRVGAAALASRGFTTKDFERVAEFLLRCMEISLEIQSQTGTKLDAFVKNILGHKGIEQLRAEVTEFASRFPLPGA